MADVHKLEEVDLRKVWPNEAQDFTPWLASNPEHLGELIGIDLELEGAEMAVGRYSADIVFRDATTGDRVVVENWLEPTDHDHLGKLITYAAGLQATYGVLVAKEFRPEHRSALSWLNSISKTGTGFFGIEVHAVRIADSPEAVKLDVVVEPDDWSREVSVAVELSEGMARYRDWWSEFLPAFHERHPGWSNATKPQAQGWMNFPARKSNIQYTLTWTTGTSPLGYGLRVELYMDDGARFYPHLEQHQVLPGVTLNASVVGLVPQGAGYLLVAADGGIFNFGNSQFHGSIPGLGAAGTRSATALPAGGQVSAVTVTGDRSGYTMLGANGIIWPFGTLNTTLGTFLTTNLAAPPNPGDIVDCTDFTAPSFAQQWFETYRPFHGDPAGLDTDNDGIACEAGQPVAPSAPRNMNVTARAGELFIFWRAPASAGSSPLQDYVLEWRLGTSAPFQSTIITGTLAVHEGLSPGQVMQYRVSARNAELTGPPSGIVSGIPLAAAPPTTTPTTTTTPRNTWGGASDCEFDGTPIWGSVYVTDYSYSADFTIYVTDYSYSADISVYMTDYSYSASSCGRWHLTDYSYSADFTIYITDYSYSADFTIYVTDYSYSAGR